MKPFLCLSFIFVLVGCQKLSKEENLKLQKNCGKAPFGSPITFRRSIHTRKAARSEAAWLASIHKTEEWFPNITLEERGAPSIESLTCSASLISPRHVITAAHCVVDLKSKCNADGTLVSSELVKANIDRITVAFTEMCGKCECKNARRFEPIHKEIKQIFFSNKYTDFECEDSDVLPGGDVAVIELASEVQFSDLLYPICLNDKTPKAGDETVAFGYGTNSSSAAPRAEYSSITECDEKPNFDTVCAKHKMTSTCRGDSGSGRVVFDRRGAAYVAAITSGSGQYCGELLREQQKGPVKPLFHFAADVSKHLTWICAAAGICATEEISKTVEMYEERGLTENWFTLLKPLSGLEIYI